MQVGLWISLLCVTIAGSSHTKMPACPICDHTGKVGRKGANCGWFITIKEIAIPIVQSKAKDTQGVMLAFCCGFIINKQFNFVHTQHPFLKTDLDVLAGTTIREVPAALIVTGGKCLKTTLHSQRYSRAYDMTAGVSMALLSSV